MDAQKEIVERLGRIFERFLEPDFTTSNAVCFDKLITHLSAKENAFVLQAPFALEWLDKCVTLISEDFGKVHPKVISFMLNLNSLLILNEWILMEMKKRLIMDRVITIVERDMLLFNPSMKLGTIRSLSAVSSYSSMGLAYMRHTKAWRFLIDYCNKDHTVYVVREARKLLYDLLYKFSVKTKDEPVVLEILKEVIKPIIENSFDEFADNIMINVDDSELQHKLTSTLQLITYIFQQTLESEEKTNIAHLCDEHFTFEYTLWKLFEMTQNLQFFEKILTTLTSYHFAILVYEKWESGQIEPENFNKFGVSTFNLVKACIQRNHPFNLLKVSQTSLILWKKLGQRAPKEIQIENERVSFENQLFMFHLIPLLFTLQSKECKEEELFDTYIMKLFEMSCEHTLRLCYDFRDLLSGIKGQVVHNVAELAYKSIHGILAMENILERDQAVIVFQAMTYALKEFILNSNCEPTPGTCGNQKSSGSGSRQSNETVLIAQNPNVLYAVLIGLQRLIQRYRITWKESIETIGVVNCVGVILNNPNLPTRLAVQALKLVQLSIEHFLSPNMALLVDNLQGSGLVFLGPIIVKRCHDTAWEVRDSTLELVASIANISRLKFPAFQQFLVEYNISPLVYEMAKHDAEPYVRASALKVLSQLIAINPIWEKNLSKLDLIEHLYCVLYNESEGIVRKEAVTTLSKVYNHRKIPANLQNTLYSTLAHCVVADLHWEVKVSALRFWELEIEKQLTHQGMLDGTFPTVTFSKENKKIVTLTAKEINLRIAKVFNELSQRGCLGVILQCLNDDCDLEVIKTAVCVVRRLFEKLKKYNYESIIDEMDWTNSDANGYQSDVQTTEPTTTAPPLCTAHDDSPEHVAPVIPITTSADAVIEGIVSAQDINLLISAYELQLQMNGDEAQRSMLDEYYFKKYANVGAKEFISTVKSIDLERLVRSQQDWFLGTDSFVSLLDDILFAIAPQKDNIFADCY